MSYSSARLRTTLRKAGWPATSPVSVSPWISTWTRAADSRPRNSLPLRAAIPGRYRQDMAARQGMPGSLATRVTYLLEPVGGQERRGPPAAPGGAGVHHRLGRDRADPAGRAGRPGPAAGSVTVLALAYGPLVLGGYLLVGLLGWSRVAVRDHTVPQVVGGSILGAAAAFLAYAVIIRLVVLAAGLLWCRRRERRNTWEEAGHGHGRGLQASLAL